MHSILSTKNNTCPSLNIGFDNKLIEEAEANKFLGLQIDNNLNWKKHNEYIIPKLSSACFTMRTVVPLMTMDNLKLVYFAYFHSVLSYGLIFWGNSTDSNKCILHSKENG
jgi:hypothetical protein